MEEQQEQAIPFLIYDQTSKVFTLTEQGEEVIRNLNSNFGVISVAGMYRTGKSYLLNRMLLNREKGFSVGPTVNPCTKGLWIWSKPIYGVDSEGKRLPILLIDTEGFGAFDEDTNHDIRIFTLAILLCSYFIYNSLGSIDENAIQSLSFVINLSKHIQLKTSQENSSSSYRRQSSSDADFDHEELANLFPSFMWILRDFALQLVDENGESITAKEYLEKVLDNTKSHLEQEQKNKIRKLIKTYFKDRDCFAMVRPMMKEKDLQNLENSTADKLRPEFLEQVLQIRKKILGRVKVKTFKNKPLTPDMYINLIKSLIQAMNSGKVPNIESTWISICKVESYKAFDLAQALYDELIRESFNNHGITDQITFREFHSEAKEKSLAEFKSKALGEASEEYLIMLKEKIKEKYNYFSKLNLEESKGNILRILSKWYSVIEYKIQSQELKNVEDIEMEFRNLEVKINENFSKFEFRTELFNDFKSKVLNFAGNFFSNKMEHDIEILRQENNQIVEKLNVEMNEMKSNHEKEIGKKKENIEELRKENEELKENLNKMKESFGLLEKEKALSEKNLQDKIDRIKEEFDRKHTEIILKNNQQEDKVKEFERKAITVTAEAEKEKALYEQKIDQLTKQVNDYAKKEKESGVELKSQIKEQAIALKEALTKHENSNKNHQREIESLNDKLIDLESTLSNKSNNLEMEKNRADELEKKLTNERLELNEKINTLKQNLEKEKTKLQENLKSAENNFSSKENLMKIKLEEAELKAKTAEESMKNSVSKLEREAAILKQNNEFLEMNIKEITNQMEEQKKNHETVISALESKTFSMVGHDEFQNKVQEIKDYFENDKKQNEENFEKSKNLLMLQIDSLTEKLNETEFKSKFNIEELQKEISDLKIRGEKNQKELQNLRAEKFNLTEALNQASDETQEKMRKIIDDYERKMEEKESKHQREISELNNNSEESINQLKILFESEKIRFEEKIKEEKSKMERKIKNLVEDHEQKYNEMENELKNEIENLQGERDGIEEMHRNYVSHSENEIGNLVGKLENSELSLKETKEAYNNLNANLSSQIEQITKQNTIEREELSRKMENLINENNKKEKEITSLQYKKDQFERIANEKNEMLMKSKKEFEEEKNEILSKVESYKDKYQKSNDDFMMNKLEYTRSNALLNQQIEYLSKKVEEKEAEIEENHRKYDERLFSLRADVEKDMKEKFERLQKEKDEIEAKLLQKKKEIKDIEQTFIKQNNLIEKEKAILNEKLISLEEKKKEMQENYERELNSISSNLNINQKDILKERQELANQIEVLKSKLNKVEMDAMEKNTELEKNKILYDGKYKFIEQQKDTLKKDLNESQKRFEVMLESIQKKAISDKEKMENTHRTTVSNLEQKYMTQIKELQETHQKLYSELLSSNKELDRQVKSLNMQAEIRNKNNDSGSLIRQIEDLTEERNRLMKEKETIRTERDKKLQEALSNVDKEREAFKVKSAEVDEKMKEVDNKKRSLGLEFAVEKTRWDLERTGFLEKISEHVENYQKMEKKYENLVRENEKLKSEKSNHKRSQSKGGINSVLKDMNTPVSNPSSGYNYSTKNQDYSSMNKGFGNMIFSNNPYNSSRDSNAKLDTSSIDNSIDTSRNFNEKSFDRYDIKLDKRYDTNKDSNFGGKFSSILNKPMGSSGLSHLLKPKGENGSSNQFGSLSYGNKEESNEKK